MKIIDLLNKIANDENYRPIVKYKEIIYKYEKIYGDYVKDTSPKFGLFSGYCINMILNDEVEIIEEYNKIEKIDFRTLNTQKEKNRVMKDTINEIIDKVNKIGE